MLKAEIRQTIHRLKQQHSQQQLAALSLRAISQLQPLLEGKAIVALYHSLPDEVCTHTLTLHLYAQGTTVLLPRVTADNTLQFCPYRGPHHMQSGPYRIMEPCGQPFTNLAAIDAIVVPGVAFDPYGHRLGRGRGYYDRFLSAAPSVYKIGLCFPFQLVSHVPAEDHDIPMDTIVCGQPLT